jgi:signal transduction histidine kinase
LYESFRMHESWVPNLDNPQPNHFYSALGYILAIAFFLGLYYLSLENYLLFHSMVEGYSTVIAFAIFIKGWNARRYMDNGYLLYLGIAYLFVGLLDFLHFLAYKGMGVFPAAGPNLPTQLWLASRYMESISLLTAFFFVRRRVSARGVLTAYFLVTAVVLASIFYWRIFPQSYVVDSGLTSFKIYSEYVICLLLLASLFVIYKERSFLDKKVRSLIVWSIILTILAELAFTRYVAVYGFINTLGHLFKIVSFFLIYKAIVFTSFTRPFDLIFKELKEKDKKLEEDLATIRDLERDRDVVLSMLVHDMKTPLISIKGFSNLLLKKTDLPKTDKSRDYLQAIHRQSNQLEKLIHYFLLSSQSGEHKLVLNLEQEDLTQLLRDVADEFKDICEMLEIRIKLDLPSSPLSAWVDKPRLQRAINNLMDNAIRFSPRHSVISLGLSSNGRRFSIKVQDQGPGIPEKDMDKIFTPFFRGAGQKDGTGYGLGLAGVKTIVESHEGEIQAGNAESGGARFIITLPHNIGQ